ncbi:hypothetical protein AAVH_04956 [Aphelenchoides avenae]|nr:hypothetical protein AAVH_04956 [Aphelenchus avenae]
MVNLNILKRKTSLEEELTKKPRILVQEDADKYSWTEVEETYAGTSDDMDNLLIHAQEILGIVDMLSGNQNMISEHESREEPIVEANDAEATLNMARPTTGMTDCRFDQVVPDCATTAEQERLLFTSDGLVRLFVDTKAPAPAREHFTGTTDRNRIPVICIQLYEKVPRKIEHAKLKFKSRKRKAKPATPAHVKLLEIIFDGIELAPLAVPRVTVTVQMVTSDYIEVLVRDCHTRNERFAGIDLSVI